VDQQLRLIAFQYGLAVQHFNDYAEQMDWSVMHESVVRPPERAGVYRSFRESTRVKDFDEIHLRVYMYLLGNYPDILSGAQQDFQAISTDAKTEVTGTGGR